jgi:hypothetical protein
VRDSIGRSSLPRSMLPLPISRDLTKAGNSWVFSFPPRFPSGHAEGMGLIKHSRKQPFLCLSQVLRNCPVTQVE